MSSDEPAPPPPPQKTKLHCPCGEWLQGEDEDDLVARAQAHLAKEHPALAYTREEILFLAF